MHESNEATATMPAPSRDILTEILHDGAQRLLTQAIDAEVADWIDRNAEVVDDDGRRQVVRNGHHPTRTILTGVGSVEVTQPRVHDRRMAGVDEHGQAIDGAGQPLARAEGEQAFDAFIEMFVAKYPAAVECLKKDRDVLLAFYDFPAEHWIHLRTTNPIESTFATVRLRHRRTKGNGSRAACLTMVFKLCESAARKWRALNGTKLLPEVIAGIRFVDGEKPEKDAA